MQNICPALALFERSSENRWPTLKVVSRQPSSQISLRVDTPLSCFLPKFPLSFHHIYTIFCHIFASISVSFHIATGPVHGSEDCWFLLFLSSCKDSFSDHTDRKILKVSGVN